MKKIKTLFIIILTLCSISYSQYFWSYEAGWVDYIPQAYKTRISTISSNQKIGVFHQSSIARKDFDPLPFHGLHLEALKHANKFGYGVGLEFSAEEYKFHPHNVVIYDQELVYGRVMNLLLYGKGLAHLKHDYKSSPFVGVMGGLLINAAGFSDEIESSYKKKFWEAVNFWDPLLNKIRKEDKRKKINKKGSKYVQNYNNIPIDRISFGLYGGVLAGFKINLYKKMIGVRIYGLYSFATYTGNYGIQDLNANKDYYSQYHKNGRIRINDSPILKLDYSGLKIYITFYYNRVKY